LGKDGEMRGVVGYYLLWVGVLEGNANYTKWMFIYY
jgi:hypothetical protein